MLNSHIWLEVTFWGQYRYGLFPSPQKVLLDNAALSQQWSNYSQWAKYSPLSAFAWSASYNWFFMFLNVWAENLTIGINFDDRKH